TRLAPLRAPRLSTLDLRGNSLRSARNLEHLSSLKSLDLADNAISNMLALRQLRPLAPMLKMLDLSGNPVIELPGYCQDIVEMLPSITSLNGMPIRKPWRLVREDGKPTRRSSSLGASTGRLRGTTM
ncbi:unnamed protein product, partial [Phaeothamnion confervicola]